MSSFKLTFKAKTDLKAIAKYTEKHWGTTQRNIYIKQFDDSFHILAESPSIGKACDRIKFGYHKFPQGSHIIFYKTNDHRLIEIIRILHKNMDVVSKFDAS